MDPFSPTNSERTNVCENECQTPKNCKTGILQCLREQLQFTRPPPLGILSSEIAQDNHDPCKYSQLVGTKESCASMVNNFHISQLNWTSKNRAAVLICIFEGLEGELRVILTKRSMKLSTHPEEVALPGGKTDEMDADDTATALREAMEEIGLGPNLVQLLANLEPFVSSHLLTVVPVVGFLARPEEFKPVLNADEVDAIFDVPLEMFLKEDSHRCLERQWEGCKYVCHLFDFKSSELDQATFLIGGLTASILIRAASIIYQRSPSFTQLLPDFTQLQRTVRPIVQL